MQKYANGTRVKVKIGHPIWSKVDGILITDDIMPELKEDIATVINTSGSLSETDSRYSANYSTYVLKFDKYGEMAWFDEKDLILLENEN